MGPAGFPRGTDSDDAQRRLTGTGGPVAVMQYIVLPWERLNAALAS